MNLIMKLSKTALDTLLEASYHDPIWQLTLTPQQYKIRILKYHLKAIRQSRKHHTICKLPN